MRCRLLFLLAGSLGCSGAREVAASSAAARSIPIAPAGQSASPAAGAAASTSAATRPLSAQVAGSTTHPTSPALDSAIRGLVPIRGLYLYRFAPQSAKRLKHLIGIADSTEVNAFVIDVKDEFGLNFLSADPVLRKNQGTQVKVANLQAVVDTVRAHGILPIARIVVFKDSVTARMNPDHTIRKPDGSPWRDKKGLMWVNPYATAIWEYNYRVAEEAARMGFAEIQFDYIRFPEPYKSLPSQVFPEANNRSKTQALEDFLTGAKARLDKLGVKTTADVFGLVTTVGGPLEVGQLWEPIAKSVDVVLPMTYPSHYPHGAFGFPFPNAKPYDMVHIAVSRARERNEKLGLTGERVRPWLQAFTLGQPRYGPEQIQDEKRGVYDSGYDGWVLWEPGARYDPIRPALEKTLVSRKKVPPVPRPPGKIN